MQAADLNILQFAAANLGLRPEIDSEFVCAHLALRFGWLEVIVFVFGFGLQPHLQAGEVGVGSASAAPARADQGAGLHADTAFGAQVDG